MMRINGHKFQKLAGSIPTFEARKMIPITTNAIGQKTLLGMALTPIRLLVPK
jgi:hypothetical protein